MIIIIYVASAFTDPVNNSCPVRCTCDIQATEYIVDCTASNLNHLPDLSKITTEIHRLRLSNNKIKDIQFSRKQKRSHLWALWLDGNIISELSGRLLAETYPYLTLLNIRSNKIVHIGRHFFTGLWNLKTLDLEKNQIKSINRVAFNNLSNLDHLYLSHNRLQEVLPEWFDNLTSLNLLDLSYNNIKRIPSGLIWPVTLHTIRLSNNNLSLFAPLPSTRLIKNERWTYDIRENPLFCGCKQPSLAQTIPNPQGSCKIQFQCHIGLTFKSFNPKLCKQNESISSLQHSFLSDLQSQKVCEPPNNMSLTIHLTDDTLMIAKCVAYGYPSPRVQIASSSGDIANSFEEENHISTIFLGPVPIASWSCEAENLLGRLIKKFDPSSVTSNVYAAQEIWSTFEYNGIIFMCIEMSRKIQNSFNLIFI